MFFQLCRHPCWCNTWFNLGFSELGQFFGLSDCSQTHDFFTSWHGQITGLEWVGEEIQGLAWVWHGLVDTKSLTRTFPDWGSRIPIGRRKADGKLSWFSVSVWPYEASTQSKIYGIGTFQGNSYLVAGWRTTQGLGLKPRVWVQVVDKHEVSSRTIFKGSEAKGI